MLREDSEADRLDALVKLLEEKLVVWTSDNGNTVSGTTVTIAIDWPDAADGVPAGGRRAAGLPRRPLRA